MGSPVTSIRKGPRLVMRHTPPKDTTYLYLIRHAATPPNEQRPYVLQGRRVNQGLSASGRRQAASLARFLSGFSIDHIYSSPLRRAVETAEAVAGHHKLPVSPVDSLVEVDVGLWEGKNWDSIMRDHPEEYRAFMENPAENPYVGGESYGDVSQRVEPVLQRLLEKHAGETIVVVAHNVVNRVYLSRLLGLELRQAKDVRQTNTGVNLVRYRDSETALLTLNAVFHLEAP